VGAEASSPVRLATLNWDCPAGDTAIRAGLYGVAVPVPAGLGPLVAEGAWTGVAVAVGVAVLVAVGAGELVADGMAVLLGAGVAVLLAVGPGVLVGDGMAVLLEASVAVLIAVGPGVLVGDGMAVLLGAGVAVLLAVGPGVLVTVGGDTVFVGAKVDCGERLGTMEGREAAPEGIAVLGACWVTRIIVGAP
jgi:hypothetical protein